MINYVYSVMTSMSTNVITLQNLVLIAMLALFYMVYKRNQQRMNLGTKEGFDQQEGFDQRDSFVLKQDQDVYDSFYCSVYDTLVRTGSRSEWELMQVLKMTQPTTANSAFLDIGCGCGHKIEQLRKAGYKAYGLESSDAMIEKAATLYPLIHIKKGDVMDPMHFDKSTFSHILCTHFTIYEMENKLAFFRNCYGWMSPNGYLILHLVDPKQFNAVVPVTKNKWRAKDPRARLADTLVDFYDFHYHAHYEFSKDLDQDSHVEFTETFTDKATGKVRKNEQTLYMESISDILKMANRAGFVFHGKVTMKDCNKDENQYLFVLERMM